MFPQIDTLPGTQSQRSVAYRYRQLMAENQAAHVRWHVIRSFRVMSKQRIAIRRHALSESLQVAAHLGIGVFRDAQTGAGMAQEQMAQSAADAAAAQLGLDLRGHLMKATPARCNDDFSLPPHRSLSVAWPYRCRQPASADGR